MSKPVVNNRAVVTIRVGYGNSVLPRILMRNPNLQPPWKPAGNEPTGPVLGTRLPASIDTLFRQVVGDSPGWFVRFAVLQFLEAQGLLPEDSPYLPWTVRGDAFAIAATEDQALEPTNQKRLNPVVSTGKS